MNDVPKPRHELLVVLIVDMSHRNGQGSNETKAKYAKTFHFSLSFSFFFTCCAASCYLLCLQRTFFLSQWKEHFRSKYCTNKSSTCLFWCFIIEVNISLSFNRQQCFVVKTLFLCFFSLSSRFFRYFLSITTHILTLSLTYASIHFQEQHRHKWKIVLNHWFTSWLQQLSTKFMGKFE